MTRLRHVLRRAFAGLRAAPFVHGVAALTVAMALVLSGLAAAVGLAGRALLDSWGIGAELTVYLADGLPGEEAASLRARVESITGAPARLVTPAEALARLKAGLGEDGVLLDELPENPLPASIEVRPAVSDSAARLAVATQLAGLPGVAEVDRGQALDERLRTIGGAARAGGAALLLGILLGAAALAGSAVRLGVWARREEIEILRLVGATPGFVRAPFVVEGLLSGTAGGLAAAVTLFVLAHRATPIAAGLPLPAHLAPLALASPLHLGLVIVAGGALGLLASAVSVGRHLRP